MTNSSEAHTFNLLDPKYTVKSVRTECPWCNNEIVISFIPNENRELHQSKRCQHCYRALDIRVSGYMITVTKKNAKGTITVKAWRE